MKRTYMHYRWQILEYEAVILESNMQKTNQIKKQNENQINKKEKSWSTIPSAPIYRLRSELKKGDTFVAL